MGIPLTDRQRALAKELDLPQAIDMLRVFVGERLSDGTRASGVDALMQELRRWATQDESDPFAAGLVSAADLPSGEIPTPLWFGVYPRSITLLSGETGAGKSSLILNVALDVAGDGGRLFRDSARHLRVLYIDPENSGNYREGDRTGGLCGRKIARTQRPRPPSLHFHDGRGVDLSSVSQRLRLADLITRERFELVVLDPLANLFNTKDENDNAEAAHQMKALNELSRSTGVAILAIHHLGKDANGIYGRGASARLAAADVGVVLRARAPGGDDADDSYTGDVVQRHDECRYQIVKDRFGGFGRTSLYLRMLGEDQFGPSNYASWKAAGQNITTDRRGQAEKGAREAIFLVLADGDEHSRPDILREVALDGISRDALDRALLDLRKTDDIRYRRGKRNTDLYKLPDTVGDASTDPQLGKQNT
jgi:hypothetical protein